MAVTLIQTPDYLGILPLYLFLTALTPVAVYFVEKGSRTFLVCSFGAYLAAQFFPHISFRDHQGTLWYFNLLAWQFVFVIGILLGNRHLRGQTWSVLSKTWPVVLSCAGSLSIAFIRMAGTSQRLAALLHTTFWLNHLPKVIPLTDKVTVGPLRLLNLLILMILAHRINKYHRFWTTGVAKSIINCGQNSLQIFGTGVLLSYVASMVLCQRLGDKLMASYVSMLGCALLLATSVLMSRWKTRRKRRTHSADRPAGERPKHRGSLSESRRDCVAQRLGAMIACQFSSAWPDR